MGRSSLADSGNVEQEEENDPRGKDPAAYFLASHEISSLAVTASLFSSNIGSEHFIGLRSVHIRKRTQWDAHTLHHAL